MLSIPADTSGRTARSTLVFNRYGDRVYLAEMITPYLGARFSRSKAESASAKAATKTIESFVLASAK